MTYIYLDIEWMRGGVAHSRKPECATEHNHAATELLAPGNLGRVLFSRSTFNNYYMFV